jgi:uncharacterized protein (TIGR00661 family)
MPGRLINHSKGRPKVLVAPLDWGLGHATRCVPLISILLNKGCQVVIAANGPQKLLLQEEFPTLRFIELEGYNIRYSRKWLMLGLVTQLNKIRKAIRREHKQLVEIIAAHQVDWVISDNRYGLYAKGIPSTFITHQLNVLLPPAFSWAERLARKYLYRYINKFNNCWVPDLPDSTRGLSGTLGHPKIKPLVPIWYTGWLSRFSNNFPESTPRFKCIIVLSGPEPQRTMLEEIILGQLKEIKEEMVLVRGLPQEKTIPGVPNNILVFNHLPAIDLKQKILESQYLVARSGYSTLMDAFTLQKKCIFIPTPGQTEQEFLGRTIAEKQMGLVYPQNSFSLKESLEKATIFPFHFPLNSMNNLLEIAVDSMLARYFSQEPASNVVSPK